MSEDKSCVVRARAEELCVEIENALAEQGLIKDTEQMGHFWQHLCEAATLRLIRLKPEMVRHLGSTPDDDEA
jgi:hypothetical protein